MKTLVELQYSVDFFIKNLRNYRKWRGLSQEKFSDEFASMKDKSGRANISLYELGQSSPSFDFIFEFVEKTGLPMDKLFSKEIDFSKPDLLNEPDDGRKGYAPPSNEIKELREKLDALWTLNMRRAEHLEEQAAIIAQLLKRIEALEKAKKA